MIGMVFNAFANIKYLAGQVDQAISFEETALRYKYLSGDPENIAISHHNLAIYLGKVGSQLALDHMLALLSSPSDRLRHTC